MDHIQLGRQSNGSWRIDTIRDVGCRNVVLDKHNQAVRLLSNHFIFSKSPLAAQLVRFCSKCCKGDDGVDRIWQQRLVALVMMCFAAGVQADVSVYNSERLKLTAGLDVTTVAFSQNNPWFGEDVANIGVEVDEWLEVAVTPALGFSYQLNADNTLFGTFSAVGTKTYGESADGLAVAEDDPDSGTLEQAFLGWRRHFSETHSLEILGGNFNYEIGTGFLIKDGGGDGGNRGGFYVGARSAFRKSGLVRFNAGNVLAEGFYLGNNPRRGGIKGDIAGVNLEYDFSKRAKIGFAYIDVAEVDDAEIGDIGEKLRTYDFRAEGKPTENLTLSGEYAFQDGAGLFEGEGWWLQASYGFANTRFKPTLTYRYAVVTGDDPLTAEAEGFEPLAYGFTDYEQWYQGEIVGNWIFANTNQRTHLVKGSLSLTETITLTGAYLNIKLDEPGALGVTSDDFGDEFDFFLDWEATDRLFLSAAVAILFPGDGAKQFTGGDDTWSHLMLYASYSY